MTDTISCVQNYGNDIFIRTFFHIIANPIKLSFIHFMFFSKEIFSPAHLIRFLLHSAETFLIES